MAPSLEPATPLPDHLNQLPKKVKHSALGSQIEQAQALKTPQESTREQEPEICGEFGDPILVQFLTQMVHTVP